MDTPRDVPVRSARDRIIDFLGIGDTYPLTDLNVVADQLKVAFGGTAKIPIENAQAGVVYQLCDPKGNPLGDKFAAEGADDTLVIETPVVSEDITYRIRAAKNPRGAGAQDPRFLDEGAPVKVGIDTQLVIEILQAPVLDSNKPDPQPSDARVVAYGAGVDVRVNNSQEGVQYSLILDGRDAKESSTGDLGAVVLSTGPMYEDAVIQVRATKSFQASENRNSQTTPLDGKLHLKVLANPALAVSVDPPVIVDYGKDTTIRIAKTQASVAYRAYLRRIRDAEFVHGAPADGDVVAVPVPGKPDAQVRKPPQPQEAEAWRTPEDYAALGYQTLGDAVPGNGGDVVFPVKALTDDSMVIVQAVKQHQADPGGSTTIASSIRLDQAVVALARPDPARNLTLRLPLAGAQTGDRMLVSGGQPGVFYYFRPAPDGGEFPLPAYFHKRDDDDAKQNKGVDQLGVEIDFAIAADPDGVAVADRAQAAPRAPVLAIAPFATGGSLAIRALKAQSAVETGMAQDAPIAAVPAIRADPGVIDRGAPATIRIPASDPKDVYSVLLKGAPVRPEIPGDNTELTVITEPLTADTVFEVVAARPADKGARVERVMQLAVLVRPDTALVVAPDPDFVGKNAVAHVVVRSSERGVVYQLASGATRVGPALAGTGADIVLATDPILADATFSVVAERADNPQVSAVLKMQATVKLAPEPKTETPAAQQPGAGAQSPDAGGAQAPDAAGKP